MSIFLSRETVNRLMKDVKEIIKNPLTDNGIYYIHDETDILKGYAMIVGPDDTPYFGGFYFFELTYPTDYPHSPPKVKYLTNGQGIRFNPNLYVCGKVCISILNTWSGEQWSSCQTISTVLLTFCSILCNNPLLNEPGVTLNHHDVQNYNKIIEFSNIHIAICDMIERKMVANSDVFINFYPFMKEQFLKNFDKINEFAVNKQKEYISRPLIKTSFYNLSVVLDYDYILERLKNAKQLLDNEGL